MKVPSGCSDDRPISGSSILVLLEGGGSVIILSLDRLDQRQLGTVTVSANNPYLQNDRYIGDVVDVVDELVNDYHHGLDHQALRQVYE